MAAIYFDLALAAENIIDKQYVAQALGLSETSPGRMPITPEAIERAQNFLRRVWSFHTDTLDSVDLDEATALFLSLFQPRLESLLKLKQEFHLKIHMCIVIVASINTFPSLIISDQLMQFARTVETEIEIDVYLNEAD
jgi:hypothetical protein